MSALSALLHISLKLSQTNVILQLSKELEILAKGFQKAGNVSIESTVIQSQH